MVTDKFKINIKDIIFFILVPAVNILVAINTKSFWGDEILSLKIAQQNFQNLYLSLSSDYHPPLYFLLLKGWIEVFSSSEISLRVFQGLQGVLYILISLLLFRKFLPNHRYHTLWLLLISSSTLWLFVPMLRYYTLAAILVMFSTLIFLNWIDKINFKFSILLCASYVLLLYTDYPASFTAGFHLLYVILKERNKILKLLVIDTFALILFSPWIFITLKQIQKLITQNQIADLNLSPLAIPLKVAFSIYAFIVGETIYPFELVGVLVTISISIAVIYFFLKIKKLTTDLTLWYSGAFFITAIIFTSIITTFISTHTSFIYTPSRTFFALPFLFLFLGAIYSSMNNQFYKYLLITALLFANVYGLSNYVQNRHFLMPVYATPWKDVLNDLKGQEGIILVDESLCYQYYQSYLKWPSPIAVFPNSIEELYMYLPNSHLVYLILTGRESTQLEINEEIVNFLKTKGKKIYEKKYLLLDESYRNIKSKILGRDTYEAKLTLYKYQLPETAEEYE